MGHERRRIRQGVRDPLDVGGGDGGALGRLQGPWRVETLASSSSGLPAQNGRRRPNPLALRYGRPGAAQTAALAKCLRLFPEANYAPKRLGAALLRAARRVRKPRSALRLRQPRRAEGREESSALPIPQSQIRKESMA